MAYDEGLAERVTDLTQQLPDLSEKRMFGGWGLMWQGNLLVGVIGDDLVVRVGPDAYEDALRAGGREFDFTGRPMKGWVMVPADAVAEEPELAAWIDRATRFVKTLPAK